MAMSTWTIFKKTRTPLSEWFAAIYLVSHDKRDVSATLVAELLFPNSRWSTA